MGKIAQITESFLGTNQFKNYQIIESGLINKTYLIQSASNKKYILQQINNSVFKDVPSLMNNLVLITEHFQKKIIQLNTRIPLQSVKYYPNLINHSFYYEHSDKTYWRLSNYIENTIIKKKDLSSKIARESGWLFGVFIREMADIDLRNIKFTIPDFHATHLYFKKLHRAACNDSYKRLKETQELFTKIKSYHWLIKAYKKILKKNAIPLRLVHNDTKTSNILFNKEENALAIIDLDTCMPGYLMSDFGDSIRSLCNTGKEDDENLNNVSFNIDLFKSYSKGFLSATKEIITKEEKENLSLFTLLITYEQVIRFYTDYINGDVYYKTDYANHNLQRTKAQLKLLDAMHLQFTKMKKIIER